MEEKKVYKCTVRLTTSFPDPKQVIEEGVDDHFSDSFATVLEWEKQ